MALYTRNSGFSLLTEGKYLSAFFLCCFCTSLISCAQSSPGSESTSSAGLSSFIALAERKGFTHLPVSHTETSFLNYVLPPERGAVASTVLLRSGDRVAAVYWYETPESSVILQRITERSFDAFSPSMSNLVDEVIDKEDLVPIDILAYTDPKIGEERFIFAVVGNVIYEFHVAQDAESLVQGLLLALAKEANADGGGDS